MNQTAKVMKIIQILGYLGLIPFLACAGLTLYLDPSLQNLGHQGLIAYGACILTFLGGIHWGALYRQINESDADFWGTSLGWIWGVIPSLISFAALLTQGWKSYVLLIVGLSICWLIDQFKYPDLLRSQDSLNKILQMRTILTIGATLSLTTGLLNN